MEKMYTAAQVAEHYGVKTFTVWDWLRKGKLTALKIGRAYRIRESDLDEFEASRGTARGQE